MRGFLNKLRLPMICLAGGMLVVPCAPAQEPAGPSIAQGPPVTVQEGPRPLITPKQKRDLLKDQFQKMKKQAAELSDLAQSLQNDLDKSNENVMSLKVIEKAEKIEKLSKKIKEEARGF